MIEPYSEALLEAHFPSYQDPTPDVFELAIACCGGTSTGPYVAGVLDFLWEAFEEWRKAAAAGAAPAHKVRIRYLVGASAGGLSLGLASLATIKAFPHVYDDRLWAQYHPAPTPPQPKEQNPHYRAWVREITLDRLLSNPNEVESGQIYLFHSAPAEICNTVLAAVATAPDADQPRDWVCDPLELRTTIGNLQGIPYALDFNHLAAGAAMTSEFWEMHRDNIGFAFSTAAVGGVATGPGPAPDCHELPHGAFDNPPPTNPPALVQARALFDAAMVATSAIPLVFKVTEVPQNPLVYAWRTAYWDRDQARAVVDQPVWAANEPPPNPINYAATDGGLFDNQPFNVAHQRLAGVRGRNPQDPATACRAVLLIDPLAQDAEPIPHNPDASKIFEVITKLVLSPILQDRLDTMDLAQIKAETIYSRFMIAPSRVSPINAAVSWSPSKSLLSAPLDAFLGFAAEPYREHDFLLGRRNAQQFLRRTFALPSTSPIVSAAAGWRPTDEFTEDGVVFRPLVPLRGRAADEQPLPVWDWRALTPEDVDRYTKLVGARADAIFHNIKTSASSGGGILGGVIGALVRLYLDIGWALGARGKILDAFKTAITQAQAGLDPARLDRN